MFNQKDFSESKFQKGNVEKFLHGQLRLVNVFSKEQLVWARAPRKSVLWEWTPSGGQCARSAAHGFALAIKYFPTPNWSGVPLKANVVKVLAKKSFKVNTCWSFHSLMTRFVLLKSSLVRITIWKMTKYLNRCCPCVMCPDNPDHHYQPCNGRREIITKMKTIGQNSKKKIKIKLKLGAKATTSIIQRMKSMVWVIGKHKENRKLKIKIMFMEMKI